MERPIPSVNMPMRWVMTWICCLARQGATGYEKGGQLAAFQVIDYETVWKLEPVLVLDPESHVILAVVGI